MRILLQDDIGRLVEDASPIRRLFNDIKGRISEEITESLERAAYIEHMQTPVSRALRHMADRAQLAKTREEANSYKHRAQEVHQRINFLESCRSESSAR
ncbi:hypothetical protein C2845_PM05G15960 [Panicum miliaceum]|uniref:Uncharacterized protein n=1 Tax=Panicum miliaceum TaxID=4540 RepID=A0A3L6T3N9_PANMI|nr:hypothetical protein C2845_PM05G15960 [Panicum miliaceum]